MTNVWRASDAADDRLPRHLHGRDLDRRLVLPEEAARPVKRAKLGRFARRAGLIVVALIVLDLAAGAAALALGAEWLKR
jgi:hypothetical protein